MKKLNCCNHGDAYGWLRLRICYFGERICYFGDRICYFGDRICYFGERICYIGDAYGWLRLRICYFGLSITHSTGVSLLKCCKKIVGWVDLPQPNLMHYFSQDALLRKY
ncbi:MAG: hypothetical protein ACYT04_50285 [Nostoc sp.]